MPFTYAKDSTPVAPMVETIEFGRLKITEDTIMGRVDLDGFITSAGDKLIGFAYEHGDGTWACLADVQGTLCWVEIRITITEE